MVSLVACSQMLELLSDISIEILQLLYYWSH